MKKENVRNIIIIAVALLIAMNYDKIMSMLRKGVATVDAAANNPNPKWQKNSEGEEDNTLLPDIIWPTKPE